MRLIVLIVALYASSLLAAGRDDPFSKLPTTSGFEDDYEVKQWQEIETKLPAAPKAENLQSFYVGAAVEHKFFVDAESLSVGSDGVVRYTLLVQTSGGAKNISYEGMRCETRERRVYAFGQPDGSWTKARSNGWVKVRDVGVNRYHAALFLDFFCPGGVITRDVNEIRRLMRRGGTGIGGGL